MQEIVQSADLETYLRSNRRSQSYADRASKSRHARLDCGKLMAGIESTRPNSMMDLDAVFQGTSAVESIASAGAVLSRL